MFQLNSKVDPMIHVGSQMETQGSDSRAEVTLGSGYSNSKDQTAQPVLAGNSVKKDKAGVSLGNAWTVVPLVPICRVWLDDLKPIGPGINIDQRFKVPCIAAQST